MGSDHPVETITAFDLMAEECELLEHKIEQAEASDDPQDKKLLPKLKHALEYFVQRIMDEVDAYEGARVPMRWRNKNKTVH